MNKQLEPLFRVLVVKISVTIVFWCIPLLFFPASWFVKFGLPAPEPMMFVRLLGAAFLALVVGYSFGLDDIKKGKKPTNVIWMGIVSNGFACIILTYYLLTEGYIKWNTLGQIFVTVSALTTFCITILLIRYRNL